MKVNAADKRGAANMAKVVRRVRAAGVKVQVGVLASAGTHAKGSKFTNAELAAIHEYGAPDAFLPSRPFIRGTIAIQRQAWNTLRARLLKAVMLGKLQPAQALGLLGVRAAADIQNTIRNRVQPYMKELSERTIKAKGSSTPLIDTGRLVGSISYEVTNQ